MNEKLNAWLDGEIDLHELPPEVRDEARKWGHLLKDVRDAGPQGAPLGLEARIIRAVREARRPAVSRALRWWLHPQVVHVRPWFGLAGAGAVVVVLSLLLPRLGFLYPRQEVMTEPPGAAATLVGEEVHYVQFRLEAPDATSVHAAGDFNDWHPEIELSDPDGDGEWVGRVRLSPGVHKYMFLIDGEIWITDPYADRYVEDGFGNRNAVIAITGGGGARSLAP